MLGFDYIKEMYKDESYFKEAYEACMNLLSRDKFNWIEYMLHEGLLFKGIQLCIPKYSIMDNLL